MASCRWAWITLKYESQQKKELYSPDLLKHVDNLIFGQFDLWPGSISIRGFVEFRFPVCLIDMPTYFPSATYFWPLDFLGDACVYGYMVQVKTDPEYHEYDCVLDDLQISAKTRTYAYIK